jgi:hypothetical protein
MTGRPQVQRGHDDSTNAGNEAEKTQEANSNSDWKIIPNR